MRIRTARPDDLPATARLAAELVRTHHHWDPLRFMHPPGVEEGYLRWLARELRDPAALVLVAEDELSGAILGYAYGRLEERDWAALLDEHGELVDLFVDPSARRGGIGRALVEEAVRRLEELGAPRVVLSTAVDNAPAQALFRSLGFRPTMLEMTRESGSREAEPEPGRRET